MHNFSRSQPIHEARESDDIMQFRVQNLVTPAAVAKPDAKQPLDVKAIRSALAGKLDARQLADVDQLFETLVEQNKGAPFSLEQLENLAKWFGPNVSESSVGAHFSTHRSDPLLMTSFGLAHVAGFLSHSAQHGDLGKLALGVKLGAAALLGGQAV